MKVYPKRVHTIKLVEVTCCMHCPKRTIHYCAGQEKSRCMHPYIDTAPFVDPYSIPEWCPLEDKKEG